ncbi:hypothetical protein [Zunongwangia endophytica]|uniref:Uncharacterized protein n=1 Tax=Zunongwangia endophytica TaxID=1808945 RepID=A0ABV8HBK0_9FLAO|nr:hypothetical protein [Zunongwangia endophytica]MDN3593459.1 hypothetical protein [Zunongwangia endophytica]
MFLAIFILNGQNLANQPATGHTQYRWQQAKNNDMKNKTNEQLESNLNLLKGITIALIFVLTLLIVISIYGLIMKENNSTFVASITVAISCSAILPLLLINMNKIKKELNSRK